MNSFSTVCPVCLSLMQKKNHRTYECSCGNWMYVQKSPFDDEVYVEYRSDVEAPASFYPGSTDIFPGYCRGCGGLGGHYPECKKDCTFLGE